MPTLRVLVADPKVRRLERAGVTWIVSGHPWAEPLPFEPGPSDGAAEAALCRRLGDATVIRIDLDGDVPHTVRLWKGASSSFELYYAVRPCGDVIVADHFRNVVSFLSPEERRPPEEAVVDHFLFRHIRGRDTYSRGVRRPGCGDVARIDLARGEVTVEVFHRLDSGGADPRPPGEYVARLDAALDQVMKPLRTERGAVGMLSGGADSTLLASYLQGEVPLLHVAPDSERFHLGGRYLDHARRALGVEPEVVRVRGDEFVEQLEEAVDQRGLPPHFPHWVTLTRVFSTAHEVFGFGERASMLSRSGGIMPHRARRLGRPPASLVRPALRRAAAHSDRVGLKLLAAQAYSLAEDPFTPQGWASQISVYADRPLIDAVFGPEAVAARLEARVAYVRQRIDLLPVTADRYFRHLELASWLAFFNENVAQGFRQLALAYGKSVVDPFITAPVMDAILSVPPSQRYCQGAKSKYLVETLLQQRLPAYPPGEPKDRIVLPFARYYADGPLAGIWDRYDVPEFFARGDRDRLLAGATESTWNAVTWAVWTKRIADNADLAPIAAPTDLRWAFAGTALSPS